MFYHVTRDEETAKQISQKGLEPREEPHVGDENVDSEEILETQRPESFPDRDKSVFMVGSKEEIENIHFISGSIVEIDPDKIESDCYVGEMFVTDSIEERVASGWEEGARDLADYYWDEAVKCEEDWGCLEQTEDMEIQEIVCGVGVPPEAITNPDMEELADEYSQT